MGPRRLSQKEASATPLGFAEILVGMVRPAARVEAA